MKRLDLAGHTYHWLTVSNTSFVGSDGALWWRCKCRCGTTKDVRGADLRRGFVKSCGCWNSARTTQRNMTHGQSHTRLYRIWQAMWERTTNPNAVNFKWYGERGIRICAEWGDFAAFSTWAALNGYEDHLTIDRKDVDGDYSPGNCRWATQAMQVANSRPKRTTKLTRDIARQIRNDPRRNSVIAAEYGVSASNIHAIKHGNTWKEK